ncbi:MAG: inositol monophosphatase family protein [Thermodesulfobacteriota bacterium]
MTTPCDSLDLDHVLKTALAAARRAGQLLGEGFSRPKSVQYKGEINLVTQYDTAAEKAIVGLLRAEFPTHRIVAEEGGGQDLDTPCCWYIDPLDGTTNFAHGFPVFSVSIGFEAPGPGEPEMKVGVIFDPLRDETFTAVRGRGAFLNGHRLEVTGQNDLNRALLVTGFPYDLHEKPDPVLPRFRAMCLAAQAVRRAGSAALDLAYVAAGRCDGFWEQGLLPWDTAAGLLLVEEAGGKVTDFSGRPYRLQLKEILATNGRLHYNMLKILGQEV